MELRAFVAWSVVGLVQLPLATPGLNFARADYCTVTCHCHVHDRSDFECEKDYDIKGSTILEATGQCLRSTFGHGWADDYQCVRTDEPLPIHCSGEAPPSDLPASHRAYHTWGGGPSEVCVETYWVNKLYCWMYDHPRTYTCTFKTGGGGPNPCPYMYSRAMVRRTQKDGTTLVCWLFNSENVGRPRDFWLGYE